MNPGDARSADVPGVRAFVSRLDVYTLYTEIFFLIVYAARPSDLDQRLDLDRRSFKAVVKPIYFPSFSNLIVYMMYTQCALILYDVYI